MKYNSKTTAIPEIIPVVLICTAGIISAARMHPQLALLLHRDYFQRPDASLSCSFAPQGLFPPAGCISIFLFCLTGIISTDQMHLCLPLLSHRDYFHRSDASLSCSFLHRDYFHRSDASLSSSFAPQRSFLPPGFIPSLLFCFTGIISTGRIHPCLPLLFHRDYFGQPNASLIRAPVKYQRPNFYYTGNTRMASADTLCKKLLQDRQK